MEENTGFSIIVPVYNVQDYLKECIQSVLHQNYDNYEIILIDDGSTDESGKMCDDYALNYEHIVVIHQRNLGLSAARNTGIRKSVKKYIIFLDSDDMLCDNALVNLHKFIYQNDQPQLIVNRRATYNGVHVKECGYFFGDEFLDITNVQGYRLFQKLPDCWLGVWIFVCRRDYVTKEHLLFYEGIFHEDEEWVPRVFMNTESIRYNNSLLYCYRVNREGSIMATLNIKRITDKLKIIDLLQREFQKPKYNIDVKKVMFLRIQAILFGVLTDINKYNKCQGYRDVCRCVEEKYSIMKSSRRKIYVVSYYILHILGVEKTSKVLTCIVSLKKKI